MPLAATAPSAPPQPASRRTTLLALLAVILACAPPLFIELGTRDSTHTMENIALLSSQETWQRMHAGERDAWLMPTNNGQARIQKPPLLVWLNLIAWSDLEPATTEPATLVYRSRLVSASLTLLMIAAIFWLGLTLADLRMAVLSSLIAGTMIFLQRQGRTASYDIHMTAWATAAVAAALWAMQPFRAALSRNACMAGWTLAGVFAAASLMSKSPLALLLVAGPAAAAMTLDRRRWRSNLIGLVAALAISALLFAPWLIYAFQMVPKAKQSLIVEFEAARDKSAPIYYYLAVFGLVAPWTLWLIAGVIHPLLGPQRPERSQRLFAWLWFMLILIAFSLHPEAKQQRYILPIVPAAALLAGQVWWDHDRHAKAGRHDSGAAALARVHWIVLTAVSLAAGFFLAQPQRTVDWHWSQELPISAIPWPWALTVGGVATALSVLGWRWHVLRLPMRAGLVTGLWALVVTTAFWYAYAFAPTRMTLVRLDAQRVAGIIRSSPMRYLLMDEHQDMVPEEEFRFYTGRIIPPVTPAQLRDYAAQGSPAAYVLTREDESARSAMRAAGFTSLGSVQQGMQKTLELWSSEK